MNENDSKPSNRQGRRNKGENCCRLTENTYFLRTEVLPFMATDVTRISNEAGLDSSDLEQFMLSSFKKEKDKGLLTPEELAEFVMCGLTGKTKGQKDLCLKGVKKAVSR